MTILSDNKLYFVGGVVRDELLKIPSLDIDYCFEGNAIKFAKDNNFNIVKENPDFGTVRILHEGNLIDIASTRTEFYPEKGKLPKVENVGCSLFQDLKRRDFTINAIAKNTVTGEIVDYFNGQDDIRNKKLKVLHKNSFIDDPTRIVRGLKFSVRFGFELDEETKCLQEKYLKDINYNISYHRLKKELVETFSLKKSEAFDKFISQNVYKLLGPQVTAPNVNSKNIDFVLKSEIFDYPYMLYLGFFDLEYLPLTRGEKRIIEWLERLKTQKPTNNTPKESLFISNLLKESIC